MGLISIQVSFEASTLSFMMSSISLSSVTRLVERELPNFFEKGRLKMKNFFREKIENLTSFFFFPPFQWYQFDLEGSDPSENYADTSNKNPIRLEHN